MAASEAMETLATVLAMVLVPTPECARVPSKWSGVGDGVVGEGAKGNGARSVDGGILACGVFHGRHVEGLTVGM